MKLARVWDDGAPRLGRVEGETITLFEQPGGMLGLIQAGAAGLASARAASGRQLPLSQARLAAPIENPSKIVGIGLNYVDHAAESHLALPKQPLMFAKLPSSIVGPGQAIQWSAGLASKVDYEAELVVVIGRPARNVSEAEALSVVFGYTCGNDVSARDLQGADGQWVRAKSLDTFTPLGPWIVTGDEIPDPQALTIRGTLNGQQMQGSPARDMVFGVAHLIAYLSRSFTLLPGDLIFTGTPPGVGDGRTPPVYLKDGDEYAVEIDSIGRLANRCQVSA